MKRNYRRRMAGLLIFCMLLLQGCSKNSANTTAPGASGMGEEDQSVSMGRYLEQEVVLPEEIASLGGSQKTWLSRLKNGDLALMGEIAGLYLSSDGGKTWAKKETPWYEELKENSGITDFALGPDGSAAVLHSPYESAEVGEDGNLKDALKTECLYVDPSGHTKTLKGLSPEQTLFGLCFGKDSRLYGWDLGGRVYEIDPEGGSARKLLEVEGLPDSVCATKHYLVLFTTRGETVLCDLENKITAAADPVLSDFVKGCMESAVRNDGRGLTVAAAEGEQEDVLYLACSGGLYRHVIGGQAMEQLTEGGMNSLGNPSMALYGLQVLPADEFLILYDHTRLCRYTYDPDLPSVPEQEIGIYSLEETYTIRQAVSLFQRKHPEVYVRYETGLSGDGSLTWEDAVKNLNTRILSGDGPDLLILDGLPLASYEEKGVLADLSGLVYEQKEENRLFQNLVDACRVDGKLWYLPVRFRLPLLVGDQGSIDQVSDLSSLADTVEGLRETYPNGALIGLMTEEEVLKGLGITCSGAWVDPASGTIHEENLTGFLQNARRIYQAELAGVDEDMLRNHQKNDEQGWQSDVAGEEMYYAVASSNAVDVAMENQKLGVGVTYDFGWDFSAVTTLAHQRENFGYASWQGQIRDGFLPKCMVGICAGAEEDPLVREFFHFLYGRELQDLELPSGFPMNEASFEALNRLSETDEEGMAGIILVSDDTKEDIFALEVERSPEEDFERLKVMVQNASAVCMGDPRIEQAVWELGEKAVNGSADVEDTVAEIVRKAAIYLSE
ncbi:MAG: carbohydrate ABC transporter substrate-binding protein [Lachnospiraceae bacterium]|nr:carbohydrate ABC transporter substrate-binding protein [Lachnospiraceae bacterium]